MSINIDTTVARGNVGRVAASTAATIRRWWGAYLNWRVQEAAIAHLKSMSDRELRDIGLTRVEIEAAVRRGSSGQYGRGHLGPL